MITETIKTVAIALAAEFPTLEAAIPQQRCLVLRARRCNDESRQLLAAAKSRAGELLGAALPGRVLLHAKYAGAKRWQWTIGSDALAPVGGLAVGVEVKLTEDELDQLGLGWTI